LESRSFWLDTIPLLKNNAARRATAAQFPRSVRRSVRATAGESSGQQPGSIRLASGQWTGSVRADAGEFPAQCPQPRPVHDQSAVSPWPRNFRAASGVASDAASAQLPDNVRDVSGQLAGSVQQDANESARQSLHHSWHDGSQMTWQFPPQSTPQITKQTGWRPRSSPRGVRAISDKSSRDIPRSIHHHDLATAFP
jgi:hypothetical protein